MKIVFFATLAVMALTLAEKLSFNVEPEWKDFKDKFNKTYKTQAEEERRKCIFMQNLEFIDLHNAKYENGETTFTLGVNRFADMTEEEMKDWVKGVHT